MFNNLVKVLPGSRARPKSTDFSIHFESAHQIVTNVFKPNCEMVEHYIKLQEMNLFCVNDIVLQKYLYP